MNRRNFLGAMLGAMAAPAVVKAENLMKIIVPVERKIVVPFSQLALLNADYDGDVYNGFLGMSETYEDGMVVSESFIKKLHKNAIYGARVAATDYFKAMTDPKTHEEMSITNAMRDWVDNNRRLITPRRPDARLNDIKLDLDVPIHRITPRLRRA